jgi:hypothetical protein
LNCFEVICFHKHSKLAVIALNNLIGNCCCSSITAAQLLLATTNHEQQLLAIEAQPAWYLLRREQKTELKGQLLIWRTKSQARDLGTVQFKDSFLIQIGPNWFLGNWTLDPCLKWA